MAPSPDGNNVDPPARTNARATGQFFPSKRPSRITEAMWIDYTAKRRRTPSSLMPARAAAEEQVTWLGVFPCLSGSIVAEAGRPA